MDEKQANESAVSSNSKSNGNIKRTIDELNDSPDKPILTKKFASLESVIMSNTPVDNIFTPSKKLIRSPTLTKMTTKKSPQKKDDASKGEMGDLVFNIPTKNKFSELSKVDKTINKTINNVNNADANKKILKRIPPITIIGAMNFSKAISFVGEIAKDKYFVKYMSIGVKIQITTTEHYDLIKARLIDNNIEFYTHDVNPEKYEQYLLSGITKVDIKELSTELEAQGFEVSSVNEIPINRPRFDNEGLYRVTFKGSVDNAKLLRTRLNHTVVKWKRIERQNKLTQCRRCQNFGHGSRNCNVAFKCSKCGSAHETSTCTNTTLKCANCDGDHDSTSHDCPKRKAFIEMRQKMSAKNNQRKPPRLAPQLGNRTTFPELPQQKTKTNVNSSKTTENANNTNQWSFGRTFNKNPIFNIPDTAPAPSNTNLSSNTTGKRYSEWINSMANDPNVHPSWHVNCGKLFSAEECSRIFRDLVANLQGCTNKTEQLEVMFEIATKYILNDEP